MTAAITSLSLIAARDALAAGELSAKAATEAALARAERFNDSHKLFITLTPEAALAQAQSADAARAAGRSLGPLHGVPITVKDNIDVAGVRTTAGSKVLAERVPATDAFAVAKLRAAGAVLLGQTNMHEMALGGTSANPHYGAVRNPWAPDYIPGGSSGGAAACVALGVGYGALGTDSAGSVRIPASACGLVGFKQTHGLVSLSGLVPTGVYSSDHIGPLARSVADASLLFDVMAGYDPTDPDSTDRRPDAAEPLAGLAGLRFGLPEAYFWEGVEQEVAEICRAVVDRLQQAGAAIVPVAFETVDLISLIRPSLAAEQYLFHEPYLRERAADYGEDIRYRILASQYVLATDYIRALRARRLLIEEFARVTATVDAVVTPTLMIAPHRIDATAVEVNGERLLLSGPLGVNPLIRNTSPLNQCGQPAISLPVGLTAAGLPVGLQLFAGAFADRRLLAIAALVEQLIGFDATPPVLRAEADAVR